jgi:hypothetical protein
MDSGLVSQKAKLAPRALRHTRLLWRTSLIKSTSKIQPTYAQNIIAENYFEQFSDTNRHNSFKIPITNDLLQNSLAIFTYQFIQLLDSAVS